MISSMILAVACVVMGAINLHLGRTAGEKLMSMAVMGISVCWFIAEIQLAGIGG